MSHCNLLTILVAVSLAISGSVANSSGLGSITGPVSGAGSHDTGLREFVSLQSIGNLFIGRPVDSSIELIVIDAPDHRSNEAHLMLRELETKNGLRSLLLTASDTLEDHLRRITIYVRETNDKTVLLEQRGETWEHHIPQTIQATSDIETFGDRQLLAFPLERLGFYWISHSNSAGVNQSINPPLEPTASALLGGDIRRGLLPWGLSGLLLIVIMSLSHWVHTAENRGVK